MSELFEAFGIEWKLLLAQAVNFGLVLLALRYFLYGPVMEMLDKRRAMVAKGVEDARKAGDMLAGADSKARDTIALADNKADKILESARSAATFERARLVTEAEVRAVQITKDAEARASEEVARAKRDSEKDIARIAILAAEKVLQKQV